MVSNYINRIFFLAIIGVCFCQHEIVPPMEGFGGLPRTKKEKELVRNPPLKGISVLKSSKYGFYNGDELKINCTIKTTKEIDIRVVISIFDGIPNNTVPIGYNANSDYVVNYSENMDTLIIVKNIHLNKDTEDSISFNLYPKDNMDIRAIKRVYIREGKEYIRDIFAFTNRIIACNEYWRYYQSVSQLKARIYSLEKYGNNYDGLLESKRQLRDNTLDNNLKRSDGGFQLDWNNPAPGVPKHLIEERTLLMEQYANKLEELLKNNKPKKRIKGNIDREYNNASKTQKHSRNGDYRAYMY